HPPRPQPLPRRLRAGAAVHRRLRHRCALRRVAGGPALCRAPGHPGGGDPDRDRLAHHPAEPAAGARADARAAAAQRDHRQRSAAHVARAAVVPPARDRGHRLADPEHALPQLPDPVEVPAAGGLLLPPRPGRARGLSRAVSSAPLPTGPHMSTENTPQARAIALVSAYYDAFNRGDRQAMLALLSDDVAHDLNQGPRETGREAFAAFMQRMDASYRERLEDIVVM